MVNGERRQSGCFYIDLEDTEVEQLNSADFLYLDALLTEDWESTVNQS